MRLFVVAAVAASVIVCGPVHGASRPLDVPADKGWQHSQTELILMPQLGAFRRKALVDNSQAELDVAATYDGPDEDTYAAIYIYRPGILHVPMWFDRSRLAMSHNSNYTIGAAAGPVQRFAPPGSRAQSGLRLTHALSGQTGATALALAPVDDWLVKIRLTSHNKSPAAVDALMSDLIASIRWPTTTSTLAGPETVQPCARPLKFKRAKMVAPDLTQALLGSVLGIAGEEANAKAPGSLPAYCLEGTGSAAYSVYRPNGDTQRYIVAFGDAGIAATVGPQFRLDGKRGNYSVMLSDLDSVDQYPAFNGLPDPKQVFDLVMKSSPTSRSGRGSKTISIGLPEK